MSSDVEKALGMWAGEFAFWLNKTAEECHQIAVDHGFWDSDRSLSEQIALQHSELSEVLEADRAGNPQSEKIPEFTQVEEEYADLIIRVLDTAKKRGFRLSGAILAKMAYNKTRPYKHGKKY